MRYKTDRSLCFNLAAKLGKSSDHFGYLGASKIVKSKPTKVNGVICAHDVVLGKDGDTVCVVSLQTHLTDLPTINDGKVVQPRKRMVSDLMVSYHSLSALGATFDDVAFRGLDSNWIAVNALYFDSESSDRATLDAIDCIKRVCHR